MIKYVGKKYLVFIIIVLFAILGGITPGNNFFDTLGIASLLLLPVAAFKPALAIPFVPGIKQKIAIPLLFITLIVAALNGSQSEVTKTKQTITTVSVPTLTAAPRITQLPTPSSPNLIESSIVRVIDGDTIVVSMNGKHETVRVIGINTPEVVDPRRPVECFGK